MFYSTKKILFLPQQDKKKIFFLLSAIIFIPQLAIDLYLPSMPAMRLAFNVSNQYIQYTLAIYLIGMGLGQIIYGPLSDKHGRRTIILIGLSICFTGSLGCIFTKNIYWFLFFRFIQGFGGSAVFTCCRVILRDLYEGKQLIKITSYSNMGWVIIPILAPVAGGYIENYSGWHMNFLIIFILNALGLIAVWKLLPETYHLHNISTATPEKIIHKYLMVIKNYPFLIIAMCATLSDTLMIAYSMISPFLMQSSLSLTPVLYSWTTLMIASGYFFGSFFNSQLIAKFQQKQLVNGGLGLFFIGTFLLLLFSVFHYFSVMTIVTPMTIIFIAAGICYPNFSTISLQLFKGLTGTASAVLGLMQTTIAGLLAGIVTIIPHSNAIGFSIYCLVIIVMINVLFIITKRYEH